MKKIYALIICMLIIITPLNVYSFNGNEDDNLGEVITVSVDHYEPITISADYLQAKEFPVNVFLRGFTLGSILFGDDAPETAPFFGGLKIRHMKVRAKPGSAQYVVGSITPVLPKEDYLRIDSNGEIDLGYLVINLRSIKKEAEIPDEITLNMTADFYFDSHTKFSVFGAQDLLLETNPNEQNWLSEPEGDFWSKKGYVRVISIDKNKVKLQVYDGDLRPVSSSVELKKNEEKTLTLSGGPSFLKDKVTIKLKDLLVPQTNAELSILEPSGVISEQTVIKGMAPFTGSSWIVKKIYSDEIIFEDKDGNQISLGKRGESNIVVGDPCSNVRTITDDDFENIDEFNKTEIMCTAIKEYENALEWADLGEMDETNYYLAQAYEELKALPLAVQTYKKISSGYDNKYGAIQNTISYLEQQIEQGADLEYIDGVGVFLKSINILEGKESYFEAKIYKSGEEEITQITEGDVEDKETFKQYIKVLANKYGVSTDLALALIEQESAGFKHCCEGTNENTAGTCNPNYRLHTCDFNKLLRSSDGSSWGAAQINKNENAHPGCYRTSGDRGICNVEECQGKTAQTLACNLAAGLKHLKDSYSTYQDNNKYENIVNDITNCDESTRNKFLGYTGWDRALRAYVGFGCDNFHKDYVEDINNKRSTYLIEEYEVIGAAESKKYKLNDDLKLEGTWEIIDIDRDEVTIETRNRQKELRIGENNVEGYTIKITKIQPSDKQALVTVLPGFERAHATSDFTIRLPVEKSLIQWTPEQIDRKINSTRKIIKKLDDIVDKFGKVISAWKITCFSVYAFLTIKNAFFGNPTARKLVIEKYTKICEEEWLREHPDKDLDDCLIYYNKEHYDNKDNAIEDEIKEAAKAIEKITDYKKDFSCDNAKKKISETLDTSGMDQNYIKLLCDLGKLKTENIDELILNKYTDNVAFNKEIEDLQNKKTAYGEVMDRAEDFEYIKYVSGKLEIANQKELDKLVGSLDLKGGIIKQEEIVGDITEFAGETYNEISSMNDQKEGFSLGEKISRLTEVKDSKGNQVFLKDGRQLYESDDKYYAVSNIEGPEYATEYKGPFTIEYNDKSRPEVFPFEINPGDYKVPKTEGDGYVLGKYSAQYIQVRYNRGNPEFYAFNVGSDGKIDLYGETIIDDKTILTPDGIELNLNLKRKIEQAYNNFDKQHRQSDTIRFDGKTYTASFVKSKISQISAMQSCYYIMSPSDCKVLFNVCDPVLCPASRFDLDGKWPVDNVVSTGIIGSLVLGQWNGNIPPMTVCFTGIHAGLDNIKTMYEGYEDCLQKAKVEGESVGICNEIRSVYICEMLWREVLAMSGVFGKFSNFLASKISSGKLTSGGEYSQWNQAWTSMGNSINFFTKQYATSAFSAFTARSTEEVGAEICKAAIFGKVPAGGDFISQLTQPESPPQFTAWITELEYGSVEEGQSLYRVYYHIYAGRDRDIIYNVYMRNYEGRIISLNHESSLFAGPKKLKAGDFVDKSLRLTEPPGFNEICIQINGATPKCGFGKVSSAFSLDYVSNMLVESELNRTITDSEDCKPDYPRTSPALGSLYLPANYGLTETGVMRKCFINDPDGGGKRWERVGTCGTDEMGIFLGDCYVDHESYIKYGEEEEEEEIGVEDKEARNRFNEIEGKVKDPREFVKSDKTVIKVKIIELRKIIQTSTSDEPIYLSYNLIARIYDEYARTITEKGVTDPGGESIPEDFPCEIEYEEDRKSGLSNIVFKFEDGEWVWKNLNVEEINNGEIEDLSVVFSPPKYFRLNEGQQSNLKDVFRDLIRSLDNIPSIERDHLKVGINKLIDYANYNQRTKEPNDDYLIIIDEKGNKEKLDWSQPYFINYNDVLTACNGEPIEYNCIIETNEEEDILGLNYYNWLFRFDEETGNWLIKTKTSIKNRFEEGFTTWKPIDNTNLRRLKEITNRDVFELCSYLNEITNSQKSKVEKFNEGVIKFINFQRKNKIYVINKGEKVYTPKTGKANVPEIYKACNFKYEYDT